MPRLNSPLQVLFTILLFFTVASAQQIGKQPANERHTTSDPGSALYQRSVFAHGFIHGYEQGFHLADIDYHVARVDRRLEQAREYRASAGYRPFFGDKGIFQQGYREGFLQGYDDSIHSRRFRAEIAGQVVADDLKNYAGSSRELDAGFAAGYLAQRSNPQNAPACDEQKSSAYCGGFALGAEFAAISSGASPVIAHSGVDALAAK